MTTSSEAPIHPGTYVRRSIIPAVMSVKDAAKRLDQTGESVRR